MGLLTVLMVTKGANVGIKALYVVVVILLSSLIMFFFGSTDYSPETIDFFAKVGPEGNRNNPDSFFAVFTIIFPAFTGIAAGLGLSGDLKDPKRAIPRGTLWATVVGIIVYVLVAFKLYYSVPQEALADDHLIMQDIAIWGPIIPIGLACAAISSALGSIMIAPRTLQALGSDRIFTKGFNRLMSRGRKRDHEPVNASIVACIIGFIFVSLGDLNLVAEIIAMFFMLTYGAICMVSFFEHMSSDPAYRPTFKSKWYVSLGGGLLCFVLMFQMNFTYALASVIFMVLIYLWISYTNKNRKGLENLFKGVIFQVTRKFQLLLQKRDYTSEEGNWRPFVFTISKSVFKSKAGFDMVRWIAHRYGFGTYIHFIEGYLNEDTKAEAREVKGRLIKLTEKISSRLYLDTMISPSITSAIAQSVQLPGISGKGNNMILFEYSKEDDSNFDVVVDNLKILRAADLDICLLKTTPRGFGLKKSINIWITATDYENSNLMILLSYVLMGHPDWQKADISIFSIYHEENAEEKKASLLELIKTGRLPISPNNIQLIQQDLNERPSVMINMHSRDADLTLIGFNDDDIAKENQDVFNGFDSIGNILFVNAHNELNIE
jgi:hypothetical protein